jgi:serine/threonine protein kinase
VKSEQIMDDAISWPHLVQTAQDNLRGLVPVLIDFGISAEIPAGGTTASPTGPPEPRHNGDTRGGASTGDGSGSSISSRSSSSSRFSLGVPKVPRFVERSDAETYELALERGEGLLLDSVGTAQFASPQVLNGTPYLGTANDAWSVGVLVWMLATGNMFGDPGSASVMGYLDETIAGLEPDMRGFVARALEPDQWKRATINELAESDWIRRGVQVDGTQE